MTRTPWEVRGGTKLAQQAQSHSGGKRRTMRISSANNALRRGRRVAADDLATGGAARSAWSRGRRRGTHARHASRRRDVRAGIRRSPEPLLYRLADSQRCPPGGLRAEPTTSSEKEAAKRREISERGRYRTRKWLPQSREIRRHRSGYGRLGPLLQTSPGRNIK